MYFCDFKLIHQSSLHEEKKIIQNILSEEMRVSSVSITECYILHLSHYFSWKTRYLSIPMWHTGSQTSKNKRIAVPRDDDNRGCCQRQNTDWRNRVDLSLLNAHTVPVALIGHQASFHSTAWRTLHSGGLTCHSVSVKLFKVLIFYLDTGNNTQINFILSSISRLHISPCKSSLFKI